MTYRYEVATTRCRFNLDGLIITQPQAKRHKRARIFTTRRVLHFMGFLAFWTVMLSITFVITLAFMLMFVLLA
jgi:hypothetical protein